MRNFNLEERFFLEIIVKGRNEGKDYVGVASLFQKLAINEDVQIEINKKDETSYFLSARLDKLIKDGESVTKSKEWYDLQFEEERNLKRKTAIMFSLLDYLEKNHLIYLYELWEPIFPDSWGIPIVLNSGLHIKNHLNKINLLKGGMIANIFKIIDFEIIPSTELIEFVANDFKDKEQIRHEDNIRLQKRSINLATSLGVVSIIVAIISLVPEGRKQQIFGIAKDDSQVKQQLKRNNPNTLINEQKQVVNKKALGRDTVKAKLIPSDSLKK